MSSYEIYPWRDLTPSQREALAKIRAGRPELRSPYFDLGYFDAVAASRPDLEVIVVTRGSAPVAFLPFHRTLLRRARPAGGAMSDWHGFIAAPGEDFDAREALGAAGLSAYIFQAAPAEQSLLVPFALGEDASHAIDLSAGYLAYRDSRKAAYRAVRRQERRLAELNIQPSLVVDDRDPAVMTAFLLWKSEQLRRTGQPDILSGGWSGRLLQAVASARTPSFSGVISTLRLNGSLAAVHVGMRSGPVLHYWFPTYDPIFAEFAPGLLLLDGIARLGVESGITEIDLGPGEYRYKREFSNSRPPSRWGAVASRTPAGRAQRALSRVLHQPHSEPSSLAAVAGRLAHRVDRMIGFTEARRIPLGN